MLKIGEENEHKEEAISEIRNSGVEDNVKDPTPNPLEKYMRIIQQSREQELANKDSKKEDTEISLTGGLVSSGKDDSAAALSLGDVDEENFW